MSWRPENWENPAEAKDARISQAESDYSTLELVRKAMAEMYERGADAMLEALKAKALSYRAGGGIADG